MNSQKKAELEEKVAKTRSSIERNLRVVEDKVQEGVSYIKEQLDIKHHVKNNPLGMVGGSVVVGLILGSLSRGQASSRSRQSEAQAQGALIPQEGPTQEGPRGYSVWSRLGHFFKEEIQMAKGMALAAGVNYAELRLRERVPKIFPDAERIFDSVRTKVDELNPTPKDQNPDY
jgi:hypothetical protein